MGAMTMASSSLALRPRASSSSPSRPPHAASSAALPARRRPATESTPRRLSASVEPAAASSTRRLYSVAPYPLLLAALLPGAQPVASAFAPFVDIVKTFSLPDWLVHWGHPGNMAVVLFAMGGYGTYLGFRIKLSDDPEEKAKAKDLHPKLLGGMFFFFALGATGGVTALLTSDKPIFESPHAVTGIIGLALLTIQSLLPTLFEILGSINRPLIVCSVTPSRPTEHRHRPISLCLAQQQHRTGPLQQAVVHGNCHRLGLTSCTPTGFSAHRLASR